MPFDAVTQAELPSRDCAELHLLRHGEVDTGGRRCAYGHLDLPLTAAGRAENAALIDHALAQIPRPDGVFSSDSSRCLRLAEPLARAWGVPMVATPALREQAMGQWEGRAWEDLTREDPAAIHAWWADYLSARPPGGETLGEVFTRANAWLDGAGLRSGRWVIATHIGVIRGLLCRMLSHPPGEALRFAPPRGSHTRVLWAEAGAVIECLGHRPDAQPAAARLPMRLALSGSAGVGKTTLGRALAARYGVPFIEEGMRRRLEEGLDLHALSREETRALMSELWAEQERAEAAAIADHGGFVADRSSVDFAAFWLFYGFGDDDALTDGFMARTLAHAHRYDRVLLLPWGVLPLVADGIRTPNRWLQRHFQGLVEGLLSRELSSSRLLRIPSILGVEPRVQWVCDRL